MKKLRGLVNVTNRAGFTLVELLIVVIILAVLAAIVIPQFSSSTKDAKESALRTTLIEMRNSLELYYHQHNAVYPGYYTVAGGVVSTTQALADAAFLEQLTRYTDITGQTSSVKDATFRFGPYLKRDDLPVNPMDNSNAIIFVLVGAANVGDLDQPTVAPLATDVGWWFDVVSGKFIANSLGTAAPFNYWKW